MNNTLLSLVMIVKNEEQFIEGALNSVKNWVDEMIVIDTGSEDSTVEIAKKLGAKVSHFDWVNDFAAARNFGLSQATGKWIVVLDADERFEGHGEQLRPHITPNENYPCQGFTFPLINKRLDGTIQSTGEVARIIPNHPRIRYQGRIHETPCDIQEGHTIYCTNISGINIVHFGYDPDIYKARKKTERALPLLEASVRETNSPLYTFYLGREYLTAGNTKEAIAALEICLNNNEDLHTKILLSAGVLLAKAYLIDEQYEKIPALCEKILVDYPDHPDVLFALAQTKVHRQDRAAAVDIAKKIVSKLNQQLPGDFQEIIYQPSNLYMFIGEQLWNLQHYEESYENYRLALECASTSSPNWTKLLNGMITLAIHFGDAIQLSSLLKKLAEHPLGAVSMLFYEAQQLADKHQTNKARQILIAAKESDPAITTIPEYDSLAKSLNI